MNKDKIKRMANTCENYFSCALCPYNPEDISRFIGNKWEGGCPNYDRKLVYAMGKGYRKIADYEMAMFDKIIGERDGYLIKYERAKKAIEETAKETARAIFQEMLSFIGSRQKFCIVDDEHKTLIDVDELWTKFAELSKKCDIEME